MELHHQSHKAGKPLTHGKVATMIKPLLVLLACLLISTSLDAAEKIRIGYPDFNSSTFTLPLAQIRGFFQEEGLQAELIRIRSAVAIPALTSGEIDYHTVVSPALAAAQGDSLLDAWLFSADNAAIKTVYCRGVPVVQNGRHVARDELSGRYRKALSALA